MSDVEREARELLAAELDCAADSIFLHYGWDDARRHIIEAALRAIQAALSKPSPTRNELEDAAAYLEAQAKQADDMMDIIRVSSPLPIADPTFSTAGLRRMAEAIRNLKSLPPSPSVNEDKC